MNKCVTLFTRNANEALKVHAFDVPRLIGPNFVDLAFFKICVQFLFIKIRCESLCFQWLLNI